jgi:hypothetical protein
MMHFDVFNGDADGIIALLQLRLAEPKKSTLITGVKRDIALLKQVDVKVANSVTVLDVSLEKNSTALNQLLAEQVSIFYVDHHRVGNIPDSKYLTTLINTDANTCTSLLVNEYLNDKYVHWAIAAAFGDNMQQAAQQLAIKFGLSATQTALLAELGVYINYNGYGRSVADLHFHPINLFQQLLKYPDPLALISESDSIFTQLKLAYQQDMRQAQSAQILCENKACKVVLLADEAWARRISGVFGNELANSSPDKAHAVLTQNITEAKAKASYTVSVRAPLNNKQGADEVCIQFPTGGGRAAAAGINQLSEQSLEQFITVISDYYS